ncbi:uncharacterized protein [Centruroides vittatus]|uniref:uncharacterized protein n=2 Tax=Centruroides vittatus TaxID=120091 RepID=UPI00350EFA3E
MEPSIRLRGSYRGAFTKFADRVQEFLTSKVEDFDSCAGFLAQLQEKYSKIETIDKEILDKLQKDEKCSQQMLDEEIEGIENYNGTFVDLKTRLERRLNTSGLDETRSEGETGYSKGNFKLPKIELQKFDGNLKNYLSFWGLFKKIHEDPNISDLDKFQYLIQSTLKGSRAREVIESFPVTAEHYSQAIECLNSRFGREDVLIEVYVRELLSLVLNNALGQEHKLPIVKLYDRIETQLRSLKMLGVTTDKCASMLYPLVESSLPTDLLRIWERHLNSMLLKSGRENFNKLETLMQFLRNEIESEEKISLATSGFGFQNKTKKVVQSKIKAASPYNKTVPTGMELLTSAQEKPFRDQQCVFCEKSHASAECRKAENLTLDQRKQILIKRGACFKCLKLNHISSSCRAKCSCTVCGKPHHVLLCRNSRKVSPNNASVGEGDGAPPVCEQALANVSSTPRVLLQTLVVILRGEERCLKIRAIIDTASQRSYILKSTAERVGYQPMRKENLKHSLFGGSCTDICEHDVYKVHLSCVDDKYRCNFDVLDQSTICLTTPPVTQELCQDELSNMGISLSDCQGPIELLIGADVAGKLMTGGLRTLKSGLTAIETKLGWTILGRTKEHSEPTENLIVTSMLIGDLRIPDLWELDILGIKDPAEKQSKKELEQASIEHFEKTLKRDSDGRYMVSLPWIEGCQALPDNRVLAERRLKSTVKTLQNKNLVDAYEGVFKQWLEEQIIEEIKDVKTNEINCHYLPHRAVIKEHSTTKIRPVFDASAKERGNVSLNDCLAKGPNYIELIPSILNKFRLFEYGVIADIRKAFLQIEISEADRNFLRFLWWEGGDPGKLKVFRHRRVVFGVNSSPFLLGATLNYHLNHVPDHLQETALKLKKSMYVDNCVTSCQSKEELVNFMRQSREIMRLACFDLRGWVYNGIQTETSPVCDGDERTLGTLEIQPDEIVSVLGLNWNISEDVLYCDANLRVPNDEILTKRVVLSLASQLFDPIGFLSPVTLIPKLLMQECWKRKLAWDTPLPHDLERRLLKWIKELKFLKEVKIPRRIVNSYNTAVPLSFYIFCDASQYSYAACIYLRQPDTCNIKWLLIQARARVAPLGSVSISRLELLACLLGVRMMNTIKGDFPLERLSTLYWTDSMNALYWIKNQECWATFVMNRVNEIRSLSSPDDWNHVPGYLNPADLPSRGCNARTLAESRWWETLQFTSLPVEEWPRQKEMPDMEIVSSERKKSVISALDVEKAEKFYENYSTYWKILRVTAWIYRFTSNLKGRPLRMSGGLTVKEIKHAELVLLKLIQREEFPKGIDNRLRKLHPVIDKEGLLRVKTLVFRSKDSEDFRLPIILPGNHYIVQKLIEWKHRELNHAGVQILMNHLREKYWILRCRKYIRLITLRCSRCRRFVVSPAHPESPPLPVDRIRDAAPFEVTGVDLAGPLYLRDKQKCWIVLYTCAVYRAVHLELLTSLSTKAFLQTFRRFVARRGRPSVIYSDNGTNFVGAAKIFSEAELTKIKDEILVQSIIWKFIPPASPWWGGWWERLVGCVKQIMRRILGRASLTYEELYTIICEVEGLMNSRPLTTLSEDTEDLIPLTPNMFLQGIKETGLPDLNHLEKVNLGKRFRYLCKLRKDLRNRFRIEYLGQLQNPKGVAKGAKVIAVGDIVLVGHDNQKRLDWPLAKVVEIYPGKDGLVRVAKIKTQVGFLIRPVRRLYPLEISSVDEKYVMRNEFRGKTVDSTENDCERTYHRSRMISAATGSDVTTSSENSRVSKRGRPLKAPNRLDL